MNEWELEFIRNHRVARLTTVSTTGEPHAVPIVYSFDGEKLYTPVDEKPKRVDLYELQRVRDIQANGRVAVIIDDYSENWEQLAWVQIRGRASLITQGRSFETGVQLLTSKYPQYRAMPLRGHPLIVVVPEKVVSWRASE